MNGNEARIARSMRRDWDDRARKDAFFYIASWRKIWDPDGFFRSGEEDYRRLVEPVLRRLNFSSSGKRMLELGCGTGRMTGAFARHFSHVTGFDVSPEMLGRARTLQPELSGVSWILGNGTDLSAIASGTVDFVFSYLVLQHLPTERILHGYIAEMMRVLVDGGLSLFQFNGSNRQNMNWKGRAAWRVMDALWSMGLQPAGNRAAKLLGLDPQMGGKSWHGVAVPSERIAESIHSSGGKVLEMNGQDTPMAWCSAEKQPCVSGKLTS